MENRLNRSAQTGPPNVRKRRPVFPPAGRSSHCTRQVACRTSFLSRQADVIASFSFSACTACTDFLSWKYFFIFYEFVIVLCFGTLIFYSETFGLSGPAEKKKKTESKKSSSSTSKSTKPEKSVKSSSHRPSSSTTDQSMSTTSSADAKISDLDRKWSDRFNRLEAMLMAKTLEKPEDPVFGMVKVTPAHAPPANVVRPDPFLKPVSQPLQVTDPAVDSPATDSSQPRPAARASTSAQPAPAAR